MLSERVRKALSAFVDGEGSPRLHRAVLRLVRRSEEAQTYLTQLQKDRDRLQALPRQVLGPDFPDQVLRAIADRRLKPRPYSPAGGPSLRPRRGLPSWVGVAAAASILLTVGAVAFSYFTQAFQSSGAGNPVARQNPTNPGSTQPRPPEGDSQPTPPDQPPDPKNPPDSENPPVLPGTNVAKDPQDDPKDQPNIMIDTSPDPITGPIPRRELFHPRTADVTRLLPNVQKMSDLKVSELRQHLATDTGFRVELPRRESARAFERLEAAFQAQGISLLVDKDVAAWLKKPSLYTNFVLFTEDLTAEDFIKLIEQVAADDKKAEANKKGDAAFRGVLVFRLDKDDRKELADLLGIDVKHVNLTKPTPLAGANTGVAAGDRPAFDPRTPLPEITEHQVVLSLSGQGRVPRGTDPPKASDKPPQPRALVLPYNPVRVRPNSVEVKRFLDGRKPLRPGALQILFVVRDEKG
jgi:hypothetical protein